MRSRNLAAALVLLAATLTAFGCGGSTTNSVAAKSPRAIVAAALSAVNGASSVNVSGGVGDKALIAIDLHFVTGRGCAGHLTVNGRLGVDIVRIGSKMYLKGSAAFWRDYVDTAAARLVGGKWSMVSASESDTATLASLTDLHKLLDPSAYRGKLTKSTTMTLDGKKAVSVEGRLRIRLFVAATGKPYPIEINALDALDADRITFDEWNAPVTLTAPKDAIDIAQITG